MLYKIVFVFFLLMSALFSGSVKAAPPANDSLANAQTLSGASGSVSATTAEATRETGEYSHAPTGATVYRTVWFAWTAPETKPVFFFVNGSSGFDPAMAVYTGETFPQVAFINQNNDASGTFPRIEFAATAGTTYKIAVGIFNNQNDAGGNFSMQWSQNANPSNDNFANPWNIQRIDTGSLAFTNQNATREQGEPVHIGTSNNSIWFKLSFSPSFNDRSLTFSLVQGFDISLDTTLSVYAGSSLVNLTPIVKNDDAEGGVRSRVTFLAKAGVSYYIAVDTLQSSTTGNITLNWNITRVGYSTDFATVIPATSEVLYDDATDVTVFRPSDGVWYSLNSHNGAFSAFRFGQSGDTPAQGDYDGDGRTDYAVTRNVSGSKFWYIRNSFDETYKILQWGLTEDKAVPGDFDYDGRMDVAVFRPSNGVWYVWRSSDNQVFVQQFGLSGDIPVLGDFQSTGDGTDLAVFRPSNGTWYIYSGGITIFVPFGLSGDVPVPADYDFDRKTDVAVYRPSSGFWYYLRSSNNIVRFVKWGIAEDIPQPGDFDNNTNDLADFAVYRPSDNTWYVLKSEGFVMQYVKFGTAGDLPASSLASVP